MPDFLRGSLFISLCVKIVDIFVTAYKDSVLKSFLSRVCSCFKHSCFRRVLSAYANKGPWFRHSLAYKIIMLIAKLFDKIFGFVYLAGKKCIFGCRAVDIYKNALKMPLTDKCYCVGVLLISMPIGAMAAAIVFGEAASVTMLICWAIFAVGVMTVLVGVYGRDSVVVKIIRGFIAAVK